MVKRDEGATVNPESLSFEQAYERLRAIAAELEGETLPLETMVARYEQAMGLAKRCQALLQDADQRIKLLQGSGYVAHEVDVSEA